MPRIWVLSALAASALWAQSGADAGFTRGTLLERDADANRGEFAIRLADNEVLRYRYDAHTYVEEFDLSVNMPRLKPGEQVVVVSDNLDGTFLRYARTVHVVGGEQRAKPRTATFVPLHHFTLQDERLVPRGDLTYAGVIGEIAGERIVLHTREAGDQTILLRKDTRYLENGETVGANALKPNQRVFVRAGRDFSGQIEGYQVIWGQILDPGREDVQRPD